MNRHAAALALLGWYLLMPPYDDKEVHMGVPFDQWTHVGSYDSAQPCEEARYELITAAQKQSAKYPAALVKAFLAVECIETSDVRLLKK